MREENNKFPDRSGIILKLPRELESSDHRSIGDDGAEETVQSVAIACHPRRARTSARTAPQRRDSRVYRFAS